MTRPKRSDGRTCSIAGCLKDFYGHDLCEMHYARLRRSGSTDKPDNTRPQAERFWEKVEKTEACWNWTGGLNSDGYGTFRTDEGRTIGAHRLSYAELKGELVKGMHLDHLCRNPRCVRPDHLEQVTPLVNMQRGVIPNMRVKLTNVCQRGHSMDDAYIRPNGRACRPCMSISSKANKSGMTFDEVIASGWTPTGRRRIAKTRREEAA